MAKLNKNEGYVIKAAELLAKTVNNSADYNVFIKQLKETFDKYEITNSGRDRIADSVYNILEKNGAGVSREELDADIAKLRTVDHITMSAEEVEEVKKSARLKKGLVIAGCVVGAGLVGFTTAKIASTPTAIEKTQDNNDVDAGLDEEDVKEVANTNSDVVNPLLKFNPEDKKVLVENVYNMFADTLPKGHKVNKDNVKQEVANWTDAYIVANIENVGPDFLLKYFQSDSKDALSLIENYLRVVSQVDSDAQVSENIWNLDYMFANEADQKLVSKYQTLVANIVKETKAKNKDGVRNYSKELRKELEKLVASNGSRQYSNAAVVMSVNVAFAGANVAKVNGMADVVIPDDLRNVLYTDGAEKCITAAKKGKGTLADNIKVYNDKIKEIGGQDNVYMKAILGLYEEVEKDLDKVVEEYASLNDEERNQKFANEMSYNASLTQIIDRVNGILDTYKANKDYVTLYYGKDFFKNATKEQIKTITTTSRSASDKRIVKTVKDIDDKDFIKGKHKTNNGKVVETHSKEEQILVDEASSKGYSAGYEKGNGQGAAGKSKSLGGISVPSKYQSSKAATTIYKSQYRAGFEQGYSDGWAVYKKNKDKSTTTIDKPTTTESPVYDVHDEKPVETKPVETKKPEETKPVETKPVETKPEETVTTESEVYEIEDVKYISNSIDTLKALRAEIANLEIEETFEEQNTRSL